MFKRLISELRDLFSNKEKERNKSKNITSRLLIQIVENTIRCKTYAEFMNVKDTLICRLLAIPDVSEEYEEICIFAICFWQTKLEIFEKQQREKEGEDILKTINLN